MTTSLPRNGSPVPVAARATTPRQPSRWLLLLMAVATGLSCAGNYFAQPLLDLISHELHIGRTLTGLVVTASQGGYALGLILLVPLGDVVDRRRLTVTLFLATAAFLTLTATAPSGPVLLVGTLLTAITSVGAQVVVAHAAALADPAERGRVVAGDARRAEDVRELSAGQDLVISATRPAPGSEGELAVAAEGLLAGLAGSGVRLLLVGGAGDLTVPGTGGAFVMDGPDFPADWRAIALACHDQLMVCRSAAGVDWAYLSPAALLVPGERTGTYRLGGDELVVGDDGVSTISLEDFAVALLDEAESPKHHRSRFTVGY